MKTVRNLLGLFVVAVACLAVTDAFAAGPPGKKGNHKVVHGVVVEVDHAKGGKGRGLIKIHAGKDANKVADAKGGHVETIHVNHNTHFEFLSSTGSGKGKGKGGKGTVVEKLAHFRDVVPGSHVRVRLDHGHHAELVSILHHEGGGKGKGKGKK